MLSYIPKWEKRLIYYCDFVFFMPSRRFLPQSRCPNWLHPIDTEKKPKEERTLLLFMAWKITQEPPKSHQSTRFEVPTTPPSSKQLRLERALNGDLRARVVTVKSSWFSRSSAKSSPKREKMSLKKDMASHNEKWTLLFVSNWPNLASHGTLDITVHYRLTRF